MPNLLEDQLCPEQSFVEFHQAWVQYSPSSISGSRILLRDAVHIASIQQDFPGEDIDHLSLRTVRFLQNSDCLSISVSRVPPKARHNGTTIGYVVVDVRCRQPFSWDSGAETLLNVVGLHMVHTSSVIQQIRLALSKCLLQTQLCPALVYSPRTK